MNNITRNDANDSTRNITIDNKDIPNNLAGKHFKLDREKYYDARRRDNLLTQPTNERSFKLGSTADGKRYVEVTGTVNNPNDGLDIWDNHKTSIIKTFTPPSDFSDKIAHYTFWLLPGIFTSALTASLWSFIPTNLHLLLIGLGAIALLAGYFFFRDACNYVSESRLLMYVAILLGGLVLGLIFVWGV